MKNLTNKIRALSLALIISLPLLAGGAAFAQADITNSVCGGGDTLNVGVANTESCSNLDSSVTNINTTLGNIINIFSVVVGVVAVIMIVVGGFRYITSGGKQESVSGAKNTILYAIIGLVIVALAQIIVRFVLNKASNAT
jgi:lysylphosphatidylglycerol synthetase-like protein (DUF2156 family)